MSVITYNGITLPFPTTTSFKQEVVYDPSNTDWYCTRYDITVQTIIHFDYLATISPEIAGQTAVFTSPAAIMHAIRNKLMVPRQKLSMQYDGIDIIPQQQSNITNSTKQTTVDARNGPLPQVCSYVNMTNSSWFMTYRIIAHYWENKPGLSTLTTTNAVTKNLPGDTVLYNRWTETINLDSCNYSVRSRSGKYIIRSDNAARSVADEMRESMAVLKVPNQCVRTKSSYTVTEDGLGISYSFEDRELYNLPPAPAFEASGTYIESYPVIGTTIRLGEARVKLRGPRNASDVQLLQVAISMAARKIMMNNTELPNQAVPGTLTGDYAVGPGGLGIVKNISIVSDIFDNAVEVRIQSQLRPLRPLPTRMREAILRTSGINNARRLSYPPRGTLGYLLTAAAYYDPNILGQRINLDTAEGNQLIFGAVPGRG